MVYVRIYRTGKCTAEVTSCFVRSKVTSDTRIRKNGMDLQYCNGQNSIHRQISSSTKQKVVPMICFTRWGLLLVALSFFAYRKTVVTPAPLHFERNVNLAFGAMFSRLSHQTPDPLSPSWTTWIHFTFDVKSQSRLIVHWTKGGILRYIRAVPWGTALDWCQRQWRGCRK